MSFKVSENFVIEKEFLDDEGRTVIYAHKDKMELKIVYINHLSEKALSGFNRIFNEIIQKASD